MKQGELEGVRQLANDVADCIIPRFIVPPSSEREQEISLFEAFERTPDVSSFLAPVWARRPTLIDSTYILDEFDRSKSDSWMPRMFERARAKEVLAVPAALLSDVGSSANSFRSSIARDYQIKFGLIVPSDEMVRPELQTLIGVALASLDVLPQDCVVIADFGGADFSNPDIAAPIISAALEILQDVAPWRQIVFQGSNFPTKNPAKEGQAEFCPRNEWKAWCLAVRFDPTTARHMIFGDYAADCSKIEFGKGGMPIPHLRYTTSENWRVQRGLTAGADRMGQVYAAIVESEDFAGAEFSTADGFIARAAETVDAPRGNGRVWRQLNTTHHITQVVDDIARVRGFQIRRTPVEANIQNSLFALI
jgi:hypothetical protein